MSDTYRRGEGGEERRKRKKEKKRREENEWRRERSEKLWEWVIRGE